MTLSSDNDDLLPLTAHRDAERRMRDLANLAMRLSAAATRDDVCDVSLDRGMATLGAYAGGVLMLNTRGTCLELCASRGFPDEQLENYHSVTLDRSLPATDAVRLAQPVYLTTRGSWSARYGEPPIVSGGTQSAAALPLIVDNRVTGVLTLSFDRPREFDASDRVFMEALAHECALALERAALYDRERKARAEAEEANRAKDDFLATLSHELRTPLNAILGWAQVLKTHVSDERGVRGLDTIVRNARAQARLIDEMLDVSRIITGKLQLDPQEVLLASIVSQAIDASRPSADAKRITLRAYIDPDVGPVLGDATRLQQVIWNIVSNAIKFTPKGGAVEVRLDRVSSSARVTVADNGDGIDADLLPYIFERFRQGDSTAKRMHGGLGLGLAIVRHLVEIHGGNVSAHSDGPGKGATFTVRLPLAAVRPEEAPSNLLPVTPKIGDPRPLAGLNIVLVEDAEDSRQLATWLLEDAGAEVRGTGTAEEGMRMIKARRPDVLIADIGLPGEDGYSLIRRVRELEIRHDLPRLPAAALTAYATAEDRKRALLAGFSTHLPKPVDSEELTAVVLSLTGRNVPDLT